MDVLNDSEMQALIHASKLYSKYKDNIDPESAFEILNARMQQAQAAQEQAPQPAARTTAAQGKSTLDKVLDSTVTRQIARTATTTITRGLLGVLKGMLKR
jgi:hypothetical protein